MEKEYVSQHLKVPFIIVNKSGKKAYLCENGVLFTDEEYKSGIDLNVEYETRSRKGTLYDFEYAKSTGILREVKNKNLPKEKEQTFSENEVITEQEDKNRSVSVIIALLAFTSVISMYISTLHTATYLTDYVDLFSAWLMSASVTAYNSTAFEVGILFHKNRRNLTAFTFVFLWVLVTLFSMITTVSVFYDKFNFTETQIAQENKTLDSNKLSLSILQKKEEALRKAIELKEKDIAYRQEREFATTAVRTELNKLNEDLQKNLSEQQKVLSDTPEIVKEEVTRKESLFTFLGRLLHLNGGVLEFIMSTLSAVFVNLIAPLSLTAVTELKSNNKLTN